MLNIFSYALFPSVYLFKWNIYSCLFPIFSWVFYSFNYFLKYIVVQFQLSCLFPHCSPLPFHSHSHSQSSCIVCVHESFIHVSLNASPFFPCYPPFHSPLVTVYLFFISKSLVQFCSVFICCCCWLDSTYGWYHMVFVFYLLAYFT